MPRITNEEFARLEHKIYQTIRFTESLMREKQRLATAFASVQEELDRRNSENEHLKGELRGRQQQFEELLTRLQHLLEDRDTVSLKVEAMLNAMAMLETAPVEASDEHLH